MHSRSMYVNGVLVTRPSYHICLYSMPAFFFLVGHVHTNWLNNNNYSYIVHKYICHVPGPNLYMKGQSCKPILY